MKTLRSLRSAEAPRSILDPLCRGAGAGVLFWYGAPHVSVAANSRRYRISNRTELLPAARAHVGRKIPPKVLDGVDTVVSLRPYVDACAGRELAALRKRGIRLVGDYDDLLFGCPPQDFPGYDRAWRKGAIVARVQTYRGSLAHFDAFTASTAPIADALKSARPDAEVAVIPNRPSPAWVSRGWEQHARSAWRPGAPLVLRYLPGSPSHDRDFAVIEDTLVDFLWAHPDVHLEIVGYLRFNHRRFPRAQVIHRKKVDYEAFTGVLLSTWLNLVPLAPNVYSQARSALKLLEAAAFGVPSIATPSTDHERTQGLPSPITFVRTPQGWRDALEAAHRQTLTDAALTSASRIPSEVPPVSGTLHVLRAATREGKVG